ncbi:MAG TPA: (2Fe-2S) ferredoxin domain-containing protein [Bacillota bacterium]
MKSVDELMKIRDEARKQMGLREGKQGTRIIVGMGTCGITAGARETIKAILDEVSKRNLNNVAITQTGCIGRCEHEPIVEVEISGRPKVTYGKVSPERARQIVLKHLVENNVISEWVIGQ